MSGPRVEVTPFGDRAVLLEAPGIRRPATAWVLRVAGMARVRWPGAEVVPGLASVLVVFAEPGLRPPLAAFASTVDGSGPDVDAVRGGRVHALAVTYDGPDLVAVARDLAVASAELVARHAAAPWTVAAVGFSPGFGYLTCPDPLFARIPRRADPRSRVPAGSLALAAGMCAVYPSASPGGWQLIGTTAAVLFDAAADPPALLAVGDRVAFAEAP